MQETATIKQQTVYTDELCVVENDVWLADGVSFLF